MLAACAPYVHFRGRVRHRFLRQITDHSTFMAPINVPMYAFPRVPATPHLMPADQLCTSNLMLRVVTRHLNANVVARPYANR